MFLDEYQCTFVLHFMLHKVLLLPAQIKDKQIFIFCFKFSSFTLAPFRSAKLSISSFFRTYIITPPSSVLHVYYTQTETSQKMEIVALLRSFGTYISICIDSYSRKKTTIFADKFQVLLVQFINYFRKNKFLIASSTFLLFLFFEPWVLSLDVKIWCYMEWSALLSFLFVNAAAHKCFLYSFMFINTRNWNT
jgi:hypothetical protein